MRREFAEVHLACRAATYACVYTVRKGKRVRLPTIPELGANECKWEMNNPNRSKFERSMAKDSLKTRYGDKPSLQDEADFAAITFDGPQLNENSDRNQQLDNPTYGQVDPKWGVQILKVEWVDVAAIENFVKSTPLPNQIKRTKFNSYDQYNCYAHVARLLQVGAQARHPDIPPVRAGVWFEWDLKTFMGYFAKLEKAYAIEEAQEKFASEYS